VVSITTPKYSWVNCTAGKCVCFVFFIENTKKKLQLTRNEWNYLTEERQGKDRKMNKSWICGGWRKFHLISLFGSNKIFFPPSVCLVQFLFFNAVHRRRPLSFSLEFHFLFLFLFLFFFFQNTRQLNFTVASCRRIGWFRLLRQTCSVESHEERQEPTEEEHKKNKEKKKRFLRRGEKQTFLGGAFDTHSTVAQSTVTDRFDGLLW
jgi:hypothetical protein